jgi:hypothetical protein
MSSLTTAALGPAQITLERLTSMVTAALDVTEANIESVEVTQVDYDLPAITTAARHWVRGVATTPRGREQFAFFVKQVASWTRHPHFAMVPAEHRDLAAAGVPWRTEPAVYRSDLRDRLPAGLTMARSFAVDDLDDLSAAIWLEAVPDVPREWDLERYSRAANLLGRLAASPRVSPLAGLREDPWTLETYARGRLSIQVIPMLMSQEIWRHPLCAAFDEDLIEHLRACAENALDLAQEGDRLPTLTSHGDACPNNMLTGLDDGFVLIDFGFWGPAPVGFDLNSLLVGDIQIGRRSADTLADLDATILPAYVDGLRAEGCDIAESVVRRSHAIRTMLMTGLSAVPFDLFDRPLDEATHRIAADRATLARYCVDLVTASSA